jgi:hypothetical protein
VLLCILSIGGGILVNAVISRPPDISGTINGFMDDVKSQDYGQAFTNLSLGAGDLQAFSGTAQTADQLMGDVTNYKLISQLQGKSGDIAATVNFTVTRAGNDGSNGYNKWPGGDYHSIIIHLNYYGGRWEISDVGSLFSCTTPAGAPPKTCGTAN